MPWDDQSFFAVVSAVLLWAVCAVYLLPLRKRRHFCVRAVILLLLWVAGTVPVSLVRLWPDLSFSALFFLFAVIFFLICGDMRLPAALYCAVWAQISQQLTSEAFELVRQPVSSGLEWSAPVWFVLALALFFAVYCLLALTIARWMPVDGRYAVGPRQLTLALLLQVIFQGLSQLLLRDVRLDGTYAFFILMAQFYCAVMLYFQYTLFSKSAIRQELEAMKRIWHQQKRQYQLSRETIAIINRKCHDLKHQVAAMRAMAGPEERERYLMEIEGAVRIYDSIFQTGNEVLDTVLTEKSLTCEANGIALSCIADGRALAFLDPVDLYSLLGNALDNAIEGVRQLEQREKRLIDVLIRTENKLLLIQVINPVAGQITFRDGLPASTKGDDDYHGFGLKSIRYTAQKYGGFHTVNLEHGCFVLRVLLPLPGPS